MGWLGSKGSTLKRQTGKRLTILMERMTGDDQFEINRFTICRSKLSPNKYLGSAIGCVLLVYEL